MHRARGRTAAAHLKRTTTWPARLALAAMAALTALAIWASGAWAVPAAHHGWSGYDSATPLRLGGTIRDVQYGSPHVLVTLEVPAEPEEDGTIEDEPAMLTVVMAPPFRSEGRGLAREALQPGVEATFEGYLHRTETMELRAERISIGELTVELR